mmetsp:Transcript_34480/g.86591  ORF Transcript_34480/g.86591 Transcript_34480/m.86591 type:complete len:277 (+) Transcript_34480:5171-6001(+)
MPVRVEQEGTEAAVVQRVDQEEQQRLGELEALRALTQDLEAAVHEDDERRHVAVLVAVAVEGRRIVEPFLLDEDREALDGAIVRIEQHLRQRHDWRRKIDASRAAHHHRVALLDRAHHLIHTLQQVTERCEPASVAHTVVPLLLGLRGILTQTELTQCVEVGSHGLHGGQIKKVVAKEFLVQILAVVTRRRLVTGVQHKHIARLRDLTNHLCDFVHFGGHHRRHVHNIGTGDRVQLAATTEHHSTAWMGPAVYRNMTSMMKLGHTQNIDFFEGTRY